MVVINTQNKAIALAKRTIFYFEAADDFVLPIFLNNALTL